VLELLALGRLLHYFPYYNSSLFFSYNTLNNPYNAPIPALPSIISSYSIIAVPDWMWQLDKSAIQEDGSVNNLVVAVDVSVAAHYTYALLTIVYD
jgi:hypothetical protein